MYIDYIKDNWKSEMKNSQAATKMWDSMAGQFKDYEIPNQDDLLMKIINDEKMIDENSKVLDIGCGAGRHSIAIAPFVKSVLGVDLSSNMIEFSKSKAKEYNIKNVEFSCLDWNDINIEKEGLKEKFELVYAHMTPAINSALTFEKMILSSAKHGVLVKPSRRKDKISDAILGIIGIDINSFRGDETVAFAFSTLYLKGLNPKIIYKQETWDIKKSFKDACDMYLNRTKTYKDITKQEEEKVIEFIKTNLNENQEIEEKVNTTITAIYW